MPFEEQGAAPSNKTIKKVDMQTAALMTRQRTSSYWIALIFVAILGAIQVYFFDITFHGPDQIRDVEIARRLIHHQEWPLNGPPLFGERFNLPPGFYYLLALPLLVRDTEAAIFITFGALFALSVWYLLRVIHAQLGSRCALAYAVLAFPVFASFYTHSAWNPALVMTLSNVVLGLFISLAQQHRHDGLLLPLAAFLLVQIHPSAAPLLLGLGAYALLNYQVLLNRRTLASLLLIAGMTAVWGSQSGAVSKLLSPAPASAATASGHGWLSNLLDMDKWRDVFLMPYSAIESIQPAISGLGALTAFHLTLMLGGVLLGIVYAAKERTLRWILLTTVLWFIVSMAFLSQGAFWHLDVVHPWLAVLAAYGLARASEKASLSTGHFNALATTSLVLVVVAHLNLYLQFEKRGKYDLLLASLFFPKLEPLEYKIPGYTFKYLHEMRDGLSSRGICQDQVIGLDPMVMGNAVNRKLDAPCPSPATTGQVSQTLYFIASDQDALRFDFTKGLQAMTTVGASAIYAVRNTGALVNGKAENNVLSNKKIDYMTFLPARLAEGLTLTLPPAPETIVRVALRCGRDYPIEQQAHWKVQGAEYKKPLTTAHARYLGSNYYDLEWTLTMPASQVYGATISSTLGPLDCDVSAITRPITAH
ncbi:hypothetical protein IPV27_01345 [Acidovorax sp. SD340]|uniref:Glycosyltransferase RgtA/B/C/D-like domain-containing protein n=2 Tax=Acidovorax TaxID=12916 RepID=A0ABV8D4I5_9BURK|nr:hypothetical protein [Acidovorax sp. SD340]KQB56036.1 hypothetical protein AE621_28800 [Acidovorax sp. SD340]MBO1006300.1 hypothetical protein [Acidovorax sp. SD340]